MLGQNFVKSATRSNALAIYASLFFPDQFQYFLIPWMTSEGVQVGVVLDPPTPQLVTGVGKQSLQQIERLIYVAELGINAGDIVLN